MKRISKGFAILAAILMVAGFLLAGCQSTPTTAPTTASTAAPASTDTAPAATDTAPPPAALPFVTLKFYYPGGTQKGEPEVDAYISKALTAKYNCALTITPIDWSQWGQKQQLYLSSGEPIDMMMDANFLGFAANASKGSYLPIDDLLQKYGQDIIKLSLPGYLEAAKIGGKSYGVACNKDQATDMGFWLQQKWFDKTGFNESDLANIKYLDDMEPLLAKLKSILPASTYPIFLSAATQPNFDWLIFATKAGEQEGLKDSTQNFLFLDDFVVMNFATGEVKPLYDYASFTDYCNLIHSWFQKGYINADAATTQVSWAPAFQNDQAAMCIGTLNPMQWGFAQAGAGSAVPIVKTPINLKPGVIGIGLFCGPCLPRACPNPERSIMVLNEFFTNADLMNTWTYGLEGRDYEKVSDNVIHQKPGLYSPGSYWMMGNWYVGPNQSIFTKDIEDPATYKNLMVYNQTAFKTPLIGFQFDSTSVKNEEAAHLNVVSKYIGIVTNGIADPVATIEKMKSEDKAAGIDKICAAYQEQYKAFLATKGN